MYLAASVVQPDLDLLGDQILVDLLGQQVDDLQQILVGERGEQNGLVQAIQELRIEGLLDLRHHLVLHLGRQPELGAEKPMGLRFSRNRAPRFEVMMMMVFLKSTVLPSPSVNWPSSNTCNRML